MMAIVMIDVEAGKENLFENFIPAYEKMKDSPIFERISILYAARCYTHSDINLMIDIKDYEALPAFLTQFVLQLEGVYDLQVIQLFSPKFYAIPKNLEKGKYQHFTVTLDVKSKDTERVFNYINQIAPSEDVPISFMAYSFYSYDNDIVFTLLAEDIAAAGRFLTEKIRSIDGVVDSFLWQTEGWKFIISHEEWTAYVNQYHEGEPLDLDIWDDSFICAC